MGLGERITAGWTAAARRRAIGRRLAEIDRSASTTLRDEIEEWQAEHGDRPALLAADGSERLSYVDLAGRAHRWARWTILHGLGRGDRLALVMANRPERVAAWLGVAETGAVAALIDPTLEGEALAAALTAAAPAHVVVDAALLPRFESAAPHLSILAAVWVFGPHPMAYMRIDEALAELAADRLRPADRRPVAATDEALRLLGAEATPQRIDHRAAVRALHAAAVAAGLRRGDRLLVTEPGAADRAAPLVVGAALAAGCLAVLRPDGAPTPLADDLARHGATVLAGRAPFDLGAAVPTLRLALALGASSIDPPADPVAMLRWRDGEIRDTTDRLLWSDDAT